MGEDGQGEGGLGLWTRSFIWMSSGLLWDWDGEGAVKRGEHGRASEDKR